MGTRTLLLVAGVGALVYFAVQSSRPTAVTPPPKPSGSPGSTDVFGNVVSALDSLASIIGSVTRTTPDSAGSSSSSGYTDTSYSI